ncbi:MAG TPA: hypothetical protein VHD56_11215 [Tepidisphaeraceae bacterium]|nr:hypothetical protein [Tepidisphaeraceae bacterium]
MGKVKPPGRKQQSKEPSISAKQWELPASFSADGTKLVNLKEVVDDNVATLSLPQLSESQQAELVAKRIELQPKFDIEMVGAGKINKERAIAEVRSNSPVGKTLVEIERRLISDMIERASKHKK